MEEPKKEIWYTTTLESSRLNECINVFAMSLLFGGLEQPFEPLRHFIEAA